MPRYYPRVFHTIKHCFFILPADDLRACSLFRFASCIIRRRTFTDGRKKQKAVIFGALGAYARFGALPVLRRFLRLFGFQCSRSRRASFARAVALLLSIIILEFSRFAIWNFAQSFYPVFVQSDEARRAWTRLRGADASVARLNAPFFDFFAYPINLSTAQKKLKFGFQ